MACGAATRFVGWRIGKVFTLVGRHTSALLFNSIGCGIGILLLNILQTRQLTNDFFVGVSPVVIIGGIWFGFLGEAIFVLLSLLFTKLSIQFQKPNA